MRDVGLHAQKCGWARGVTCIAGRPMVVQVRGVSTMEEREGLWT